MIGGEINYIKLALWTGFISSIILGAVLALGSGEISVFFATFFIVILTYFLSLPFLGHFLLLFLVAVLPSTAQLKILWIYYALSNERSNLLKTLKACEENEALVFFSSVPSIGSKACIWSNASYSEFQEQQLKLKQELNSLVSEILNETHASKFIDLNSMRKMISSLQSCIDTYRTTVLNLKPRFLSDPVYERGGIAEAISFYAEKDSIFVHKKFKERLQMAIQELIPEIDKFAKAVNELSEKLESQDRIDQRFKEVEIKNQERMTQILKDIDQASKGLPSKLEEMKELHQKVLSETEKHESTILKNEDYMKQYKIEMDEVVDDFAKDMEVLNNYFSTIKTQNDALLEAQKNGEDSSSVDELKDLLMSLKNA